MCPTDNDAAYELIITHHGSAELWRPGGDEALWTSDADTDFTDEFSDEFLSEEDSDDILDYLVEKGLIEENEEIDVFEEALPPEISNEED